MAGSRLRLSSKRTCQLISQNVSDRFGPNLFEAPIGSFRLIPRSNKAEYLDGFPNRVPKPNTTLLELPPRFGQAEKPALGASAELVGQDPHDHSTPICSGAVQCVVRGVTPPVQFNKI